MSDSTTMPDASTDVKTMGIARSGTAARLLLSRCGKAMSEPGLLAGRPEFFLAFWVAVLLRNGYPQGQQGVDCFNISIVITTCRVSDPNIAGIGARKRCRCLTRGLATNRTQNLRR